VGHIKEKLGAVWNGGSELAEKGSNLLIGLIDLRTDGSQDMNAFVARKTKDRRLLITGHRVVVSDL
jgi:hypothetical protein